MSFSEKTVREFIGWLSADIPALNSVLVPDLADSWERFKALHGSEAGPQDPHAWTGLMAGFAPDDMDFSTTNSGDAGGPLAEKP